MKPTIGCFGHSDSATGPQLRRKEEANSSQYVQKAWRNTEDEQEVMWHPIGSQQAFPKTDRISVLLKKKKMQATLSLCVHLAISLQ